MTDVWALTLLILVASSPTGERITRLEQVPGYFESWDACLAQVRVEREKRGAQLLRARCEVVEGGAD